MKTYLQVFQSDAPLLPFVTSELHALLQTLMGKFVKRQNLKQLIDLIRLQSLMCHMQPVM